MERTSLTVSGMSCQHCVKAVENALRGLEGVDVEEVEIGKATVRFDADLVDRSEIVGAIEEEGYRVEG